MPRCNGSPIIPRSNAPTAPLVLPILHADQRQPLGGRTPSTAQRPTDPERASNACSSGTARLVSGRYPPFTHARRSTGGTSPHERRSRTGDHPIGELLIFVFVRRPSGRVTPWGWLTSGVDLPGCEQAVIGGAHASGEQVGEQPELHEPGCLEDGAHDVG